MRTVVASKPAHISQKLTAVATIANKPISEPVVAFPLAFDDISSTAVRESTVARSSTTDTMPLGSIDPPPFQRMTNSPLLPAMRGGNKKQQWDDANAFPADSLNEGVCISSHYITSLYQVRCINSATIFSDYIMTNVIIIRVFRLCTCKSFC